MPHSSLHSISGAGLPVAFGFTLPWSVTELVVRLEIPSVRTVGGLGNVANVWSAPWLVPLSVAEILKW